MKKEIKKYEVIVDAGSRGLLSWTIGATNKKEALKRARKDKKSITEIYIRAILNVCTLADPNADMWSFKKLTNEQRDKFAES